MPLFKIHHITKYEYDLPVKESGNQLKIFPFNDIYQEVVSHDLSITGDSTLNKFTDYWGNTSAFFTLIPPHEALILNSQLIVRTIAQQDSLIRSTPKDEWETIQKEAKNQLLLLDYLKTDSIKAQNEIMEFVLSLKPHQRSPLEVLFSLSNHIFNHFEYVPGITTIETTIDEIWTQKKGVCQDFAHILSYMLRKIGIPARYVSGYICPNRNGMRGIGATHAWVEAWMPGNQWIGVDPTNDVFTNENYVKLAIGRDFRDCTPIKGTFKGPAIETMNVYVSVGYEDGYVFQQDNEVELGKQMAETNTNRHNSGQQ